LSVTPPRDWDDPRLLRLLDELCAQARVPPRLQARYDPDDLRSRVLAKLTKGERPTGTTLAEWEAYLRRAFASVAKDEYRTHTTESRDPTREVTESGLAAGHSPDSAPRLDTLLPAGDSTPSQRAAKNEDLSRLDAAIERLPDDQRRAIRGHLGGLGPTALAAEMGRTPDAVSALIRRALLALKDELA
jgi:RNA polymerase sigma factor (sigma-70 family)